MIVLTLDQTGSKLAVSFPYRPEFIEKIKMFTGRVWRRPFWVLPLHDGIVEQVELAFKGLAPVVKDQKLMDFLAGKQQQLDEVIVWKQEGLNLELDPDTQFFSDPPYRHQRVALACFQRREAFAALMEQGTGKTRVAIDFLGNAYRKNRLVPSLIVAPVVTLFNWQREIQRFQPGLKAVVAHGSALKRAAALDQLKAGQANALIINYESFWRMYEEFEKLQLFSMVLDESTKIKNRGSRQAKAIMKMALRAKRRYIMTGTIAANNPLETFNQIRFLDPTVFGHSWYAFRDRYANMGGYGGYQILGWKNLPELTKKLAGISYRVLKKDCLDLLPKVYKEYRIGMDADQKKIYKELAEDLVTQVNGTDIAATVVLAKLIKLRQLASGFVYDDSPERKTIPLKENPKLKQLKELLPELTNGHKVVIWTTYQAEMEMVTRLCQELGIRFVKLDGSITGIKRDEAVQSFQNDPSIQAFVGQQHAGGIGINLFAADYCVFFSNDYSYEIRIQAEDRLHRSGQKNQVTYIDLIMKGTIDSSIKRALTTKENLSASLVPSQIEDVLFDKEDDL